MTWKFGGWSFCICTGGHRDIFPTPLVSAGRRGRRPLRYWEKQCRERALTVPRYTPSMSAVLRRKGTAPPLPRHCEAVRPWQSRGFSGLFHGPRDCHVASLLAMTWKFGGWSFCICTGGHRDIFPTPLVSAGRRGRRPLRYWEKQCRPTM